MNTPSPLVSMTIFELLIVCHLCGDYLFQTEYQALNKAKGRFLNRALLVHCLTYSAAFLPVFIWKDLPFTALAFIFGTHVVLDRRFIIIWWRTNVNRCSAESIKETGWLSIIVDQIFHTLVLAIVAHWPFIV